MGFSHCDGTYRGQLAAPSSRVLIEGVGVVFPELPLGHRSVNATAGSVVGQVLLVLICAHNSASEPADAGEERTDAHTPLLVATVPGRTADLVGVLAVELLPLGL